jgi:hypothetical protein
MLKFLPLLFVVLCMTCSLSAQVPTTDIYLVDMQVKHGKYSFTNAQKINDWHGYNNQPYFTPDGKSIYYVSYRNKQSDVYRYDIDDKKTIQFTNTPEDEYSPKLTPDGKAISVVRVMKDSAQQLWKFPLDGGAPAMILQNSDSVAYYLWRDNLIIFASVPEPMNLKIKDSAGYEYLGRHGMYIRNKSFSNFIWIDGNAGRSIAQMTGKSNDIIYIHKTENKKDSIHQIKRLFMNWSQKHHFPDFDVSEVVKTLPNCEDFAIGPKNTLYMGCKGKLYKFRIGSDKSWIEIADFNNTPYKNFYRIAISEKGDKIAVVAYEGKKP